MSGDDPADPKSSGGSEFYAGDVGAGLERNSSESASPYSCGGSRRGLAHLCLSLQQQLVHGLFRALAGEEQLPTRHLACLSCTVRSIRLSECVKGWDVSSVKLSAQ